MDEEQKSEERHFTTNKFIVREVGEGEEKKVHVQGYALVFDSMSEDLGFREIIRKGALDNCNMDDVVLNINHSSDKPMARNSVSSEKTGHLSLTVDDKGLFFDAIPTDTSYSRDLLENMRAGVISGCSFCFRIDWSDKDAQTWDWDDGKRGYDLRTINRISEISDVSIVTNPAYASTSCGSYKRAKEDYKKSSSENKELELRKRKIRLELELMED